MCPCKPVYVYVSSCVSVCVSLCLCVYMLLDAYVFVFERTCGLGRERPEWEDDVCQDRGKCGCILRCRCLYSHMLTLHAVLVDHKPLSPPTSPQPPRNAPLAPPLSPTPHIAHTLLVSEYFSTARAWIAPPSIPCARLTFPPGQGNGMANHLPILNWL